MLQCVKNKWLWLFLAVNLATLNSTLAQNHDRNGYRNGQRMERQYDKHGDQRGNGYKAKYKHQEQNRDARFSKHQRDVVADYYGERYHRHQKCPPGLAMKHNGCMPPGARMWRMHEPLPRDVRYYPVPQHVVVQMGLPPVGYKYVRVGTDLLMIAVGTGMVVDALNDIAR